MKVSPAAMIIVGDDALGVPFGEVTPWVWYLRC